MPPSRFEAIDQRLTQRPTNRIVILDTERLDGITVQHWWDRGDLKYRYIRYEDVIREPRVTIFAYKNYFDETPTVLCEWDRGGRRTFLRRVYSVLSNADILVGHNIDGADMPWLKNDLHIEAGLPPLPPYKTVDTLKVLRKEFGKAGAPFKSLDAICKILGHPGKTDVYDREAMERAVTERNPEDRDRLAGYCGGDVLATQWLYDWTRPHNKTHPALFVDGEGRLMTCNRCAGPTEPTPRRYVANVMTYSMRRCPACGAYSRLSIEPERMSSIRGV